MRFSASNSCRNALLISILFWVWPLDGGVNAGQEEFNALELGTIADMALISAALAINEDYCGMPEGTDSGSLRLDELLLSLEPAVMKNVPINDRWGNPVMVVPVSDGMLVWSAGPNGVLDDSENVTELVEKPHATRNDLNVSPSDDLMFSNGKVVKGPLSTVDKLKLNMADMRTISTAAGAFALDNDAYPEWVGGCADVEVLEEKFVPVYLYSLPKFDSWGNPFKVVATRNHFMVISYGSDGLPDIDYDAVDFENPSSGYSAFTDPVADIVHLDGIFLTYPRILMQQ